MNVQVATLTLTDAQIKSLPSAPIQLTNFAPPGKFFLPLLAYVILENSAGAYTNVASLQLKIGAAPTFPSLATILSTYVESVGGAFADDVAGGKFLVFSPELNAASTNTRVTYSQLYADLLAQAFFVYATNATNGNLTGGNAANSLKVKLYYTLEDAI